MPTLFIVYRIRLALAFAFARLCARSGIATPSLSISNHHLFFTSVGTNYQ